MKRILVIVRCIALTGFLLVGFPRCLLAQQVEQDMVQTDVPCMRIWVEHGAEITSKTEYRKAFMAVEGNGRFPSFSDSIRVRGRGNSSWESCDKKSYRLKFNSKLRPFGLTKGKNWVLLANHNDPSQMQVAVAMQMAQLLQMPFAHHVVPVDVEINGVYRGSYVFTEQTGVADNSVDIHRENGVLLELDSYFDEDFKFMSSRYVLPVNVKDPDLTEWTDSMASARMDQIRKRFNEMEKLLMWRTSPVKELDVASAVRFMLVNDFMRNAEIGWPKSLYLYHPDITNPNETFHMGPVWDFDCCCGFVNEEGVPHDYVVWTNPFTQRGHTYTTASLEHLNGQPFVYDLLHNKVVSEAYRTLCCDFFTQHFDALCSFIDDYYSVNRASMERNDSLWSPRISNAQAVQQFKVWLHRRAVDMCQTWGVDTVGVSAVNAVKVDQKVKSVTYYNMVGESSDRPFKGINVVRTLFTDGTRKVSKCTK